MKCPTFLNYCTECSVLQKVSKKTERIRSWAAKASHSYISNKFRIWFFEYILNVIFIAAQLPILPVSSESYNDTEHSVQVFMKLCHCIKGDHWFQTEVEEGISKLWRTLLKHRKNCECCHHHSFFKGHNVIVNIVVLNCQKCNQCLKCQVSGHNSLRLLFEGGL